MEEKLTIKQLLAILAAGLFSFCGVLIETATNITFPTLMNEFQVSTSLVQWMTTGNLLMMGILIPISSYLKRRFLRLGVRTYLGSQETRRREGHPLGGQETVGHRRRRPRLLPGAPLPGLR